MSLALLLAIGAGAALGLLAWRGARIWLDYGRRAGPPGNLGAVVERLGLVLRGAIVPRHYWWGIRIQAMSRAEQERLLARETRALDLSRADGQRCPLCGSEIAPAWTLDEEGQATVAAGPVECPSCDFRLDACRHCRHFLPGAPRSALQVGTVVADITWGRCAFYKRSQPVEEAAAPHMARSLKKRGYERVRAPMQIQDSMLRPDSCRAFDPHPKRCQASDVSWPGPRRVALLRLQGTTPGPGSQGREEHATADEKWLL